MKKSAPFFIITFVGKIQSLFFFFSFFKNSIPNLVKKKMFLLTHSTCPIVLGITLCYSLYVQGANQFLKLHTRLVVLANFYSSSNVRG